MIRPIDILLVCLAFFTSVSTGFGLDHEAGAPDVLVICPVRFQPSLKRWVDYRTDQGYTISVISPAATAKGIRKQIASTAEGGSLKHVFLVGDSGDSNARKEDLVPTDYVVAKVNVKFGSEPEIATDNTYADLDGDGIQDLSIGRLPADSEKEIDQFTTRVIEYESSNNTGEWRRRVNFVAGVGGFGKIIDGLIEQTTQQILTDLVPRGYETKMTYGSWRSPYCPDPRQFSDCAIERFNEGCMFWIYIGHGARHRLDKIYMPDQSHSILDESTVTKLNSKSGNPIAIFLACYTGATDHPRDCLVENMIEQKNGPISAICGTRVTMPYAMSLLSLEMVDEFFYGDIKTLGELLRVSKKRMVQGSEEPNDYRMMIEGMGKSFSPKPELLKQERLEHVQLIHLIGDPLLQLKRPKSLSLKAPETAVAKSEIKVSGTAGTAGKLTIELAYQRDRLRYRFKSRRKYDSSESSFQNYQKTYEQTQQLVVETKTLNVQAGDFETKIKIPVDLSGSCVVRAMLVSQDDFALDSSPIEIEKAAKNSAPKSAKSDGNLDK